MKAVTIDSFGDISTLHLSQVQKPEPGPKEVQIALSYAAVNPVDWKICEGHLKTRLPHQFPLILGWDGAGTVSAVGKEVRHFKVGDKVFAYFRKPTVQWGTFAEYVCFEADHVALKPDNIDFAEAAAIPLTALTAWQALFDDVKLQRGETVLIHAGAGGVGGIAIQLAKNAGAKVISTARQEKHSYVKELGADVVIDYTKKSFVEEIKKIAPQGVDVVFDTVGGQTLKDSLNALRPGGRLVSIVEKLDPAVGKPRTITITYHFVNPNGAQLKQIGDLIKTGKVRPPAIEEMKLEDAAQALEKSREGRLKGKIVLKIK